jgi:hypothetical protein
MQAKGRLNEKRSFFGREAVKIITEFFNGAGYANKPKAIAKYARWAVRGDGPGLFSEPTPIECVVPKGTNGYIVCFLRLSNVPLPINDVF